MKKIPFQIEINIFNVPTRHCRYYQEQIHEYYDDGRARFEWERIRHEYILGKDYTIEQICGACPLNILLQVEGCKGDLYEFETFMRMLPNVKPDAILTQRNVLNCKFDEEETFQLLEEIKSLQDLCRNISWPIALVFYEGSPAVSSESFKFDQLVYFEWSGDEEQTYFASNQGYHIGITNEGIILKKNFGETLPYTFASLSRKGMRVVGQTIEGNTVPVPINRSVLPEWWSENPTAESELRFTNLPISDIFQDVFNMFVVFGETALRHYTGIGVFSEFYRRA